MAAMPAEDGPGPPMGVLGQEPRRGEASRALLECTHTRCSWLSRGSAGVWLSEEERRGWTWGELGDRGPPWGRAPPWGSRGAPATGLGQGATVCRALLLRGLLLCRWW